MGIRCATERKCGELANTGSKVGFLGAIAIASDPGMVKTLGNILPEVMVGVEPGLTPKSALFLPGRDQKARRIHWSFKRTG